MDILQIAKQICLVLEGVGVAVIALAFAHALIRGVSHAVQRRPDAYERLKRYLGKALMLGLEILVAADIIRTVTVEQSMQSLGELGLLVLLRIILGWSIFVETEGCWPWRSAGKEKGEAWNR